MKALALLVALPLLNGCALISSLQSGTPLTPAQVQQDLANITYLMKAAGCLTSTAAAAAAPIISIAADAQGNQVLTATAATGAGLCALTVPATALPVPAPANAPATTVPSA